MPFLTCILGTEIGLVCFPSFLVNPYFTKKVNDSKIKPFGTPDFVFAFATRLFGCISFVYNQIK